MALILMLFRSTTARMKRTENGTRTSLVAAFRPSFLQDISTLEEISETENKALWKQIMKDVNRTFQYRDFFRKQETRKGLGNLLYIWSRIRPKTGYLQGMHDLASIVTMAVYFDYKLLNGQEEGQSLAVMIANEATFSFFFLSLTECGKCLHALSCEMLLFCDLRLFGYLSEMVKWRSVSILAF